LFDKLVAASPCCASIPRRRHRRRWSAPPPRRGVPLAILDVTLPEARELYAAPRASSAPTALAWRGDRLHQTSARCSPRVTGY